MDTIGFIGLGNMGGNIAARLLANGYEVHGTARRRERAQWLVDEGLHWEDTPRAVVEAADIVVTSLPDDDVLESVAAGPDGILAGLRPTQVWVEMSTVSPRVSRELAEGARNKQAAMLDAPISGSVPQIHQGTLAIMAGGDPDAYERVEPLLYALGSPTYVGDNGRGLALKLAINISLAVQMLAFSEGLVLAERAGLAPALAARVMTQSAIGSPMLQARLPLVLERPGEAWFDIGLMQKDIRLALEAGDELGVPLPSTRAVDEVLDDARERGYAHRDIAALAEFLDEPREAMAR